MRHYRYVGPDSIRAAAVGAASGTAIRTITDASEWVRAHLADRETRGGPIPATFIVTTAGVLQVAPRRSEHVACASGGDVLSAGELFFLDSGHIDAASNLSTGYCPEPASWTALAAALDAAGLARPARFTTEVVFRRCPSCGERNVVKDEHFVCALCDAELPRDWNFT